MHPMIMHCAEWSNPIKNDPIIDPEHPVRCCMTRTEEQEHHEEKGSATLQSRAQVNPLPSGHYEWKDGFDEDEDCMNCMRE